MSENPTPSVRATDLLSVKSRVSWGAIAAGAMIALAVYFLLALLGVALGFEAASRGTPNLGLGAGIYAIASILIAMFFGGWATSRLAVGETKLEAVLYGVILWGLLFAGILWLVGNGIRMGYVTVVGVASGAYTTDSGDWDYARLGEAMRKAGVDRATADKAVAEVRSIQSDPTNLPDVARRNVDPQTATQAARTASWYALVGVAASMLAVILGSLIGSGDVPVPVPVLGVRRPSPRDPRQ